MSRDGVQTRLIWPGVYLVRKSRILRRTIYRSLASWPHRINAIAIHSQVEIPVPRYPHSARRRQDGAS